MRLIFSVFAALIVLAGALFFVGPLLISTDAVRDQLLAQVESATGYRLRVDGPVKFSLFPSLDLVAEDVGVAPSADAGTEIATAKKLRFGLVWSALWGGKVQLTEVTLIDPVIAVRAKKVQVQAETGGEGVASSQSSGGNSVASALQRLTLDKLVIQNGTVILPPSGNAPGKRVEGLMLEASLPSFDGPLSFDMKAVYDSKPIATVGSIGNFGPFLGGTAAPIDIALDVPEHHRDKITLTGIASYVDDTLIIKPFTAKTASAVLTGDASYKGSLLTLHPFTAKIYGNSLSGSLAADLSGKIPAVNVALTADTLDLNKLLSGSERRADVGGRILADVGGAGIGVGTSSSSKSGAAGSGTAGSTWSDAKIDFSPLRSVNAKLKLTAQQLIYDNVKIGPASLQATLTGGKLSAELPEFKLYNGSGTATLAVDASDKTPTQRVKLSLAHLDAYPFLRDAAGFQNIEGTGAIALDLAATGASQRAMVQTLGGNAKFDFTNGAIRGINIAKMVRLLTTGTLSGWQDTEAEKTDFATLAASFQVASGQAQTSDLRVVGPLVRMSGEGTVNLPARTLQFRVNPQIVASLEGQGGQTDLQGLGVPIVIAGPWSSPRLYPDIKGILENPVAAYEQLNKLGGGLVKLPSVDELSEKAGISGVPAVSNIIKDGKIDRDALQQGAIEGLGALLNKQKPGKPQPADEGLAAPAPAPAPEPAHAAPEPAYEPAAAGYDETEAWRSEEQAGTQAPAPAPAPPKQKKRKFDTEDAAKQILQNLLGGN
ncbi:MAG: AsmA family protein [Methyloceanibacter sp.]